MYVVVYFSSLDSNISPLIVRCLVSVTLPNNKKDVIGPPILKDFYYLVIKLITFDIVSITRLSEELYDSKSIGTTF